MEEIGQTLKVRVLYPLLSTAEAVEWHGFKYLFKAGKMGNYKNVGQGADDIVSINQEHHMRSYCCSVLFFVNSRYKMWNIQQNCIIWSAHYFIVGIM